MKDHLSRLFKSDWSLYLIRGGVVSVNVLSLLLLGLLMPAEAFGRFVFIWSITLTLSSIASIGGPQYLMREMSARQAGHEYGTTKEFALFIALIAPLIALTALGSLTVLLLTQLNSFDMPRIDQVDIVVILASSFMINITSHIAIPLRIGGHQNVAMLLRDAGPQLYIVIAALLLFPLGLLSIQALFSVFILISAIAITLTAIWIQKNFGLSTLFTNQPTTKRYPFSFWWNSILGTLSAQIDILIAGLFLSPATLGTYQILKRFANLASLPQIIANWSVIVGVGKAFAKNDLATLKLLCAQALRISAIPASLLVIVCLLVSPAIFLTYNIEANLTNYAAYLSLLFSSVFSVMIGINFAVASQCHMEHHAVIGRMLGILFITIAIMFFHKSLTILTLALITTIGFSLTQFYVWSANRLKLKIDTSIFILIKTNK